MQQVISGAMLLLKLASLYFLVVALFALKKPKPIPRANPNMRFACVIAARNEERVIGGLIESLLRQTYPKALFDIYVMPNNCTDHTALAAIRAGAQVLRPEGEIRCKGDALHEVFETLLKKDYDAFCVFDADNFVDPAFLSRMNDAFCAGAKAAKGAMRVKNPEDSPLCACYGLYFTCFDFFFSRARMNCGLSSKLVGTGFAVHRSVLEESHGWNSVTIAEDAEFAAYLAETGTRVWFVPEAVTYDEAPTSVLVSLRQRRRWSSGVMDVAQAQLGSLACGVFDEGGLRVRHARDADAAVLSGGKLFPWVRAGAGAAERGADDCTFAAGARGRIFRDDDVCVLTQQNSRRAIQLARDFAVPAVYGLVASVESRVASVPHKGLARDRARETGDSGGEAAAVSEGGILSAGGSHAGTDVRLA